MWPNRPMNGLAALGWVYLKGTIALGWISQRWAAMPDSLRR